MKVINISSAEPARDPDVVLEKARGQYSSVVILGYDKSEEGYLDARASTNLDAKSILFLLEQFKHDLLSGRYSKGE